MGGITFTHKGSFKNTEKFLKYMTKGDIFKALNSYAAEGTRALSNSTPTLTGLTAASWTHEVIKSGKTYSIVWSNTNIITGTPLVIWLQYGHGTGTGGYVQGRDFINPAIKPVFDRIADKVWQEVVNA